MIIKYLYNDFLEVATLFGVETIEKYFFHEILDNIPYEVIVSGGYDTYWIIFEKFHMITIVGAEFYSVILSFAC